jgi:aminoglycoside phosphotransferase family enzyme
MQANSIEKSIASAITELEGTDIEKYVISRFSWLFFSRKNVYKVRRDQPPVITTLTGKALQNLADKEFERGRRFTSALYEGVKTIQVRGHGYKVLILNRMRDSDLLCNIYQHQAFSPHHYATLVEGLNTLHDNSNPLTSRSVSADQQLTWAFLDRTSNSEKTPLDQEFDFRGQLIALRRFFDEHMTLFQERVKAGFVLDTHGDLHSANIFIAKETRFIDPAVASSHMYQIDYLNQIADVGLDLVISGYGSFIPQLMRDIALLKSDADADFFLRRFYFGLRVLIRIALWRLHYSQGLQSPLASSIKRYYEFARRAGLGEQGKAWVF